MLECPSCSGEGSNMAFVNRGPDIRTHSVERVKCSVCGGTGKISAEQASRMELGRFDRNKRVAEGKSLREAAAERGCTAAQLSKWETAGVPIPERTTDIEGGE